MSAAGSSHTEPFRRYENGAQTGSESGPSLKWFQPRNPGPTAADSPFGCPIGWFKENAPKRDPVVPNPSYGEDGDTMM